PSDRSNKRTQVEPAGPRITTAARYEHRPPVRLGKAPVIATVAVVAIAFTMFVSAQVRKADAASKLMRSQRLIAETKSQLDALETTKPGITTEGVIKVIEQKAERAISLVDGALSENAGDIAAQSARTDATATMARAGADREAFAAITEVIAVTNAIE